MSKKNKSEHLEEQVDFEASLNELVQLVELMEQGGGSLENALKQFERGIVLIQQCQKKLQDAQQRVYQLVQKEGKEALVEYSLEQKD